MNAPQAGWLRRREVSAVITGMSKLVRGFDVHDLRHLRYDVTARLSFAETWFPMVCVDALAVRPA